MNSQTKVCQNCENDFTIESEDFAFYEKIKVPPPTWCPECRAMRRLIFWNMRNLYRKKESLHGSEVFCTYPEETDIVVYDRDDWWSDVWDPSTYGREVDFTRPFLEQIKELTRLVPWPSKSVQQMVDSDYSNQVSRLNNCYLCFNGGDSKDCLYGVGFIKMEDCVDFYMSDLSQSSYELVWSSRCYECFYCTDCHDCRNVMFSRDCRNCQDCLGCVGLRNRQYCILNIQYTKEEYETKRNELRFGSYKGRLEFLKEVAALAQKVPVKFMHGQKNDGASGDYVYNGKNVRRSFEVVDGENIKYSHNIAWNVNDCYDYDNWGLNSELIYECMSVGENCRNVKFSFDCWPGCSDIDYSLNCHSSSDLFGCVGLRSKQYCILNKQYTKEDYFALRDRIIRHMEEVPYIDARGRAYRYGEFFPSEFSPLAYAEAAVSDYYPMDKGLAVSQGFTWRDVSVRTFETTLSASDLPDHIDDAGDGIATEIIRCAGCQYAYRITSRELVFYRRFTIPLPRLCHNCRHLERIKQRNPLKLWHRTCNCRGRKSEARSTKSETYEYTNTTTHTHGTEPCPAEFETSYAPDKPEIVYCEQCYNAEVA